MAFSLCGFSNGNTGIVDCDVQKGLPQQIVVGSGEFTASNYASTSAFQTSFIAKLKLANGSASKLFPFPVIQGVSDKSTAAKFGTSGYGLQVKLLRSKPGYEFEVLTGTLAEKALIKYDGKIVPIYIVDSANNVWGVRTTAGTFKGSMHLISVEPRGFGDGANAKFTKITVSMVDSRDEVENAAFVATNFVSTDLVGLTNATISQTAANVANVYKIGVKILTDAMGVSLNVRDLYATQLAVGSLWVAKTGANFTTTLAITSVADDPANGGWTVTFDSTAYAALATGALIQLSLVTPDLLDAANITQLESIPLIITK